jgi:hypothetical protein
MQKQPIQSAGSKPLWNSLAQSRNNCLQSIHFPRQLLDLERKSVRIKRDQSAVRLDRG